MTIKVLTGSGCRSCKAFYKQVEDVVSEINADNIELIKEERITEILKYSVLTTPALVINDKVVMTGSKSKPEEIKAVIKQYM